jgi:CRP-like cAMP-binding protein
MRSTKESLPAASGAGRSTDTGPNPEPPKHYNRLLAALSPDDFALLKGDLKPEILEVRKVIEKRNAKIERVCFPDRGIISVVAVADKTEVEVGLIGCEGVSGLAVIHGDDQSPHSTYVQLAGSGQSISSEAFQRAIRKSETLHKLLLRYAQAFMIQTSHTAIANAKAKVEQRLARWILMFHDRVPGNEMALTHEFIALMLGARRPGVTEAIHQLAKQALIRNPRPGTVTVLDRIGLQKTAGGDDGVTENEYKRLIG